VHRGAPPILQGPSAEERSHFTGSRHAPTRPLTYSLGGVLAHHRQVPAGLCRSWGQIVAAGCVTLLFIGGHATEILTYWPAIVAIGLLALGTMTARMTANSLGPAMAMHAAYNLGVVIWVYSTTV
jgi:hypothetical protein